MTHTATDAAQLAGVTTATVYTWCRMGAVKAAKAGRRWVIDAASLARRIALGIRRTRKAATVNSTPWPADHPDAALLNEAAAAGVTAQALYDEIGQRAVTSATRPFSAADEHRVRTLIEQARRRTRLLDDLAHLATCLGHDGAAKRTAAAKLTDAQLSKVVADTRAYARRQGVDIRTDAEKAAAAARAQGRGPATPAQVAYLSDLLAQRRRSGIEGGWALTKGYYTADGRVRTDKLRTLTTAQASGMITSLKDES